MADQLGVSTRVHSSEVAWKVYEKHGFEIVRELDVDLDEWAPVPRAEQGEGAKWGHYVCWYMKRFPEKE